MSAGPDTEVKQTLDRLFRREAGRLVATLTRKLGAHNLTLAEDTAQEALLSASRSWPFDGIPDNPSAWLHTVAYRKAIDLLRHQKVAENAMPALETATAHTPDSLAGITDAELRLVFLCCHTAIPEQDRLALTLHIAFGFSAREIARLFYTGPAAMSARLTRAKDQIKARCLSFDMPTAGELTPRLSSVQKVVYLAFSLGYSPGHGSKAVRSDIAFEALRLAENLTQIPETSGGTASALAALLSFQASRLASRTDTADKFVPFQHQDRKRWDEGLIARGFNHLRRASAAREVSRYHLEAGIASLHALAPSAEAADWQQILKYYQALSDMTASPVVALNHAVAISMAGDNAGAITKLEALSEQKALVGNIYFHTARAEILHRLGRSDDARVAFNKARFSGGSDPDMRYLDLRLSSFD
ncbi:RNA polymerase sigma factor [Kordiimonas aestuarii]|uniref:RNA polymerase sigma factor n=1 Tax=Kordiimonas aestuarii TaxID=1005925 RepID=UPI0021CF6BC2|nr:DUF6596 domain-containing protein [Kordiimonas aestuarii]